MPRYIELNNILLSCRKTETDHKNVLYNVITSKSLMYIEKCRLISLFFSGVQWEPKPPPHGWTAKPCPLSRSRWGSTSRTKTWRWTRAKSRTCRRAEPPPSVLQANLLQQLQRPGSSRQCQNALTQWLSDPQGYKQCCWKLHYTFKSVRTETSSSEKQAFLLKVLKYVMLVWNNRQSVPAVFW